MHSTSSYLAQVFSDPAAHREVAEIIAAHLTNKHDVRAEALGNLDLSACRTILDLGCGFGFFTLGLQRRTAPGARITGIDCYGSYRTIYLDACKQAGIKGDFNPKGIHAIESMPPDSLDLILCSYALYYFPGYISRIARILHPEGTFVAITHSRSHLHELTTFVKGVLKKNGIPYIEPLPYQSLISHFTDENGHALLSKVFGKVQSRTYRGKLVFKKEDFGRFRKYFLFKRGFFTPQNMNNDEKLIAMILDDLQHDVMTRGEISLTIDDMIFICNDPVN